ncbi:MAG: hypothetical protein BWY87_00245 [Deltaproteobacteria bacterium ADurb.Bin510]|nr:MAG: hypothetical protein BWY87_00245 [Deltaproteobacteria bacterium ADurb.Bin510]
MLANDLGNVGCDSGDVGRREDAVVLDQAVGQAFAGQAFDLGAGAGGLEQVGVAGVDRQVLAGDQAQGIGCALAHVVGDARPQADFDVIIEIGRERSVDAHFLDDRVAEGLMRPGRLERGAVDVVDIKTPDLVDDQVRQGVSDLVLGALAAGVEELRFEPDFYPKGHLRPSRQLPPGLLRLRAATCT